MTLIGRRNTTPKTLIDAVFAAGGGAPAVRRKPICGRDITAGPGSCTFWFDSCPANIAHCFNRMVRANAAAKGNPAAEQAALDQWQHEHDKALEPQRSLL